MATITKRDIDALESYEALAQLARDLRALLPYVEARMDQQRARAYSQPDADGALAMRVADAAVGMPAAITF